MIRVEHDRAGLTSHGDPVRFREVRNMGESSGMGWELLPFSDPQSAHWDRTECRSPFLAGRCKSPWRLVFAKAVCMFPGDPRGRLNLLVAIAKDAGRSPLRGATVIRAEAIDLASGFPEPTRTVPHQPRCSSASRWLTSTRSKTEIVPSLRPKITWRPSGLKLKLEVESSTSSAIRSNGCPRARSERTSSDG